MVKVLNRDKIQRMVDYTGGAGTQSGSGGGGEGVSQAWVNANFVSIAYFEQLFKAYKPAEQSGDPDVEVKANTIDEDITNIKAMKGFWTEQYISALGQGSGGGGGGGASALTDLVDVSISSPSSGQVLMYDGNGHWINGSISMSGYATQAWVQQQGYLTSASAAETYLSKTNAASTYLSKTDAQTTYLSKTDAASTYLSKTDAQTTYLSKTDAANTYLSIAFFSRLFQAYNGTTAVNPNDTSSTIDSIKAMFGFWTEQYISALGQGSGGGGGGASALGDLVDVTISSPSSGQVLMYDGNGHWINGSISMSGYATQAWVQEQGYATQSYLQQNYLQLSNVGSQNVNSAKYLTTYAAEGNSNLECLQNAFASLPKSVGTAVRLQHGSASMAFGWFLGGGYDYANAYGGWFISDYGAPSWVGVDNGTWNVQSFITSANIGSQSVNYANSAGNADTLDGYHSNGLLTRFSMGDTQSGEDSSKLYLGIGGATPTSITVGYASSAYSSTYADYADRLTITRKIWGQSFDGTGDVSGIMTFSTLAMATNYTDTWSDGTNSHPWYGYDHRYGDTGVFSTTISDYYGLTLRTGSGFISMTIGGNVGIGTTSPSYKLSVSGDVSATNFRGALVGNASSATQLQTSRTIWGQSFDGSANVTGAMSSVGNISFDASGRNIGSIAYFDTANGRLGIGSAPGAYKLDVGGTSHFSDDIHIGASAGASPRIYWGDGSYVYIGELSDDKLQIYGSSGIHLMGGSVGVGTTSPSSSYKLDVSGVAHVTTGLLSDGYVTALSDVRLKKIIDHFTLKPEAIALASLIHYTWKNGHDKSVHVGGIAQEWQEILPEAVHDIDGRLTMDYGVIGMVSAVSLAKTVIEQEKRIKSLEERLAAIEAKLK